MKKIILFGLVFGICYGGAFYFSLKKVGVNTTYCYIDLSQTSSFMATRSESKRTLMINQCVTTDFNAIDRHFFPNGIENMKITYD